MNQTVKVILLTLAILICVGGTISWKRDTLEKILPRSYLSTAFYYLETQKPQNLKAVFLGSSRIHSCIKRDLFAGLLGIEQSEVLVIGIQGAGAWEELSIWERYSNIIDSAPLVIIEIEPWMYNNNYLSQGDNLFIQPGFFQWATLQERFEFPDLKMKVLLLADYVWPFSERRSLLKWSDIIDSLIQGRHQQMDSNGILIYPNDIPAYHYNPSANQKVAEDPLGTALFQANATLNNFEFVRYKAEYLVRLIRLAEKKSKKIVLLQPPLRNEYIDIMFNNPKYREGHRRVIKFLHSLENENVSTIIWNRPEDCGLTDSVFIDYGHFNISGAYMFTQKLYDELMNRGIIHPYAISEKSQVK